MQAGISDLVSVCYSSSTTRFTKASYCVLCRYGLLCSILADDFGLDCRVLFPLFGSREQRNPTKSLSGRSCSRGSDYTLIREVRETSSSMELGVCCSILEASTS